jgi:hypothetical protein
LGAGRGCLKSDPKRGTPRYTGQRERRAVLLHKGHFHNQVQANANAALPGFTINGMALGIGFQGGGVHCLSETLWS